MRKIQFLRQVQGLEKGVVLVIDPAAPYPTSEFNYPGTYVRGYKSTVISLWGNTSNVRWRERERAVSWSSKKERGCCCAFSRE